MKVLLGLIAIVFFIAGIVCLFSGGWATAGGLVLIALGLVLGSND